ncbi:uncharacterized protein LOC112679381 isoform X2 [Sipha flava]|uniref:Uncharacterized protein LOC112679381 isoform X2 n=1 Tax=Sipha flava TaxID=143950 RepID=A0A8B8F2T6_9HEMI|nr:uncharacterized protein LOC112679381 isoform X2 [Sipha flava]
MRHGMSLTAIRVALATLMLADMACTSKKQKRQLFRENVLPFFGGKIPDSAFEADRLALNMLNKEGISVPDGVLFEARPKESFYQSQRDDPELFKSIVKMIHTSDGRFIPSEGQYEPENEVQSTYKIWIPSNLKNYQLPRFRPAQESLPLPVHTQIYESKFSITHPPPAQQLRVPFYSIPQSWDARDGHRPHIDQFNQNINNVIHFQQNFNAVQLTRFACDRSGKMYPDPETQCQIFSNRIIQI